MKTILFVCTGNICRSPMAEGLFRHLTAKMGGKYRTLSAGVGAVAGHLDAMGLGEQHAEELLGEVGVHSGLDGLSPAGRDHVAHAGGLDDGGVAKLLHLGHFAADRQPLGDDRDERGVQLIDALAEVAEVRCGRFGHRQHGIR